MQRLIDANNLMEYCLNQKDKTVDCNDIARFSTVLTIPDNPTNGDMIKAMFPNEGDFETDFDADWWNAPYKGGQKND